jgi:hypothetical protein
MLIYADLIAECVAIGAEVLPLGFRVDQVDIDEFRKIAKSFEISDVDNLSDLDIIERMSDPMMRSQRKFMSYDIEFVADIFQEMKRRDLLGDFWNRFNGGVGPEI